ncbi:MAG TPA: four-helix bundle copper-binding protein [Gemmatimonadaceae bacterium]
MPRTAMNLIDPAVRRCIDQCVRCHEVCLSTIPYCLEQGNQHAEEAHITLLIDCASICQLAADFMLRGSDEHSRICAACAPICERCADDCAKFLDDEVMQACAESCRRCAESCRHMAHAA